MGLLSPLLDNSAGPFQSSTSDTTGAVNPFSPESKPKCR